MGAGYIEYSLIFRLMLIPRFLLREIRVVNNSINSQVSHRQLSISSVFIASDAHSWTVVFKEDSYTMVYYNYTMHNIHNALQSGAKVSQKRQRCDVEVGGNMCIYILYIVFRLAKWGLCLWGGAWVCAL